MLLRFIKCIHILCCSITKHKNDVFWKCVVLLLDQGVYQPEIPGKPGKVRQFCEHTFKIRELSDELNKTHRVLEKLEYRHRDV